MVRTRALSRRCRRWRAATFDGRRTGRSAPVAVQVHARKATEHPQRNRFALGRMPLIRQGRRPEYKRPEPGDGSGASSCDLANVHSILRRKMTDGEVCAVRPFLCSENSGGHMPDFTLTSTLAGHDGISMNGEPEWMVPCYQVCSGATSRDWARRRSFCRSCSWPAFALGSSSGFLSSRCDGLPRSRLLPS